MIITIFKQLRIHHWVKNILIFLPAAFTKTFQDNYFYLLSIFLSFSFLVSGLYCLNDIIDFRNDRKHFIKKNRPYASGKFNTSLVIILSASCIIISVILSKFFNEKIYNFFVYYIVIFFLYCFFLKNFFLINIITLSSFYVYRVFLGSVSINIETTSSLTVFIFFFFMTLATIKKLVDLSNSSKKNFAIKNTYNYLLIFSSSITISTLIIYLNSEISKVILSTSNLYVVIVVVTYWLFVSIHKTLKDEIKMDSIIYFFKDKETILCFILLTALLLVDLNYIIS
jgi:decaprenyl-phosphate phosphoribosyltransferase